MQLLMMRKKNVNFALRNHQMCFIVLFAMRVCMLCVPISQDAV